ncbi:MAG: biotin--[acetyl-CoA-carboxylase] ligase [Candidatus Aminicenantes bacterium]|nr:biotin--[acetyl-CoA-carboxylase] ligase [Candidatus Aminicenantes bacterium]
MNYQIHRLETCPSTNDVAREMALRGAPEGTAVVSDEQTAGRGTKGRSWQSPRGKGLYFSVILRPVSGEISLLPLAAGLAAREAVERSHGLAARLRWPNDILWQGKKLGGVLCESGFLGNRPEYVILGVGLNVDHDLDDFPEDIRALAVSVRMATQRPTDRERLLGLLLAEIERWRDVFSGPAGGDEIVRTFERHSIFRKGDPVTVIKDDERIQGVYHGVGYDGALSVLVESDIRRFTSADIIKVDA